MLHSVPGTSANRNITKLAAAAAAMTVLAGCAMAVPLHPSATSFQDRRDKDFYCRADPKCSHRSAERRIAYRPSQPVEDGQIHDPPDFILNGGEQEGTLRQQGALRGNGFGGCQCFKRTHGRRRQTVSAR
jgi:hypothetical protein